MGQKREGPPLIKHEYGPKRIKSEKFEDTKFDLRSIPPAPTTEFKVKEEANSKPKFDMTGVSKKGSAQANSSGHRGISGHYDRGREKLFLRGHGDFDWNSNPSAVGQIFDRLLSVQLHVIPASMPIIVRPSQAKIGYTHEVDVLQGEWDRQKMPAVTALLAPAPGLLHQPSLPLQAGPRGGSFGLMGADTPPSGATIKADEKDK
ncbi:hypothetical protein DL764_003389 [Monosporascus ibericus]|uniref:Uncharacterized protein n=1 Tax=Monosporascus ibericus TaxID=155417 RepID=A0A4Q4TGM0_9PEZI|nr:hypothetical protein DL764_003389 [Monosporascus ibericus]